MPIIIAAIILAIGVITGGIIIRNNSEPPSIVASTPPIVKPANGQSTPMTPDKRPVVVAETEKVILQANTCAMETRSPRKVDKGTPVSVTLNYLPADLEIVSRSASVEVIPNERDAKKRTKDVSFGSDGTSFTYSVD